MLVPAECRLRNAWDLSSVTYQDAVIWGKGHALYAGVLAVAAADDIVYHLASFYLIHVPATHWSK